MKPETCFRCHHHSTFATAYFLLLSLSLNDVSSNMNECNCIISFLAYFLIPCRIYIVTTRKTRLLSFSKRKFSPFLLFHVLSQSFPFSFRQEGWIQHNATWKMASSILATVARDIIVPVPHGVSVYDRYNKRRKEKAIKV